MTKVVVLDVDGTLMDTNYLHTEAWARALEQVGVRVPRAEVHKQIGKGSGLLVREFMEDEEKTGKVEELHGELQHHGFLLPGARKLISTLAERGFQGWLVTSAKPEELERHQEMLETEGKLAGVVNSSDVENPKPAPDIFEEALRRAGSSQEEVISVGDSIWDIKSANEAGVRTVAVLSGGAYSARELREAGAVAVHEDCAALLQTNIPE